MEIKGKSTAVAENLLGAIYQSAAPIAMERYAEKIKRLGKPVFKPNVADSHKSGYFDGFCDAVYYITTGQMEIETYEETEDVHSDNAPQ